MILLLPNFFFIFYFPYLTDADTNESMSVYRQPRSTHEKFIRRDDLQADRIGHEQRQNWKTIHENVGVCVYVQPAVRYGRFVKCCTCWKQYERIWVSECVLECKRRQDEQEQEYRKTKSHVRRKKRKKRDWTQKRKEKKQKMRFDELLNLCIDCACTK